MKKNKDDDLFDEGDPFDDPRWTRTEKAVSRVKNILEVSTIRCPVVWLVRVLPYIKTGAQLVVALLLYRHHTLYRGKPFSFSNSELDDLGICRQTKYRTLTNLEQARLIKIKQENGRGIEVTVLCNWRTGLPDWRTGLPT